MDRKTHVTMLIIILLFSLAEIALISFLWLSADEINCNYVWCTFTTSRSSGEYSSSINRSCTENGVPINCSTLSNPWDRYGDPGDYPLHGVWKE